MIDEILEADKKAPPRQRHTARRIFERRRDEYGYTGGITQVQEAVKQTVAHSKEVFLPLSHPPGRAPEAPQWRAQGDCQIGEEGCAST